MKRSVLFASIAGLVLVGGALGVSAFSNNGEVSEVTAINDRTIITMEKAKEIAVQEVDGIVKGVELEQEDSGLQYEVKIQDQKTNEDRKVQVDASTGNVTKVETTDDDSKDDNGKKDDDRNKVNDDNKVDDNNKVNDDNKVDDSNKVNDDNKVDDSNKVNSDSNSSAGKNNQMITSEEAIAIATKDTQGRVVKVELDDNHYEIEIKTGTYEIEYKIDSVTGAILEKEVDREDD
jgi:uncharacterized membrane protein YkoI